VTLCAVCTVHVETRSAGFLVEPQNQGRRFDLKTTRTVSNGLTSKPAAAVFSSLASKLVATVSLDLASKLVVSFLVEPQNREGFPSLDLKTGSSDLVICVSKSPRWFLGLSLKTKQTSVKQTSVCRLCHKTDGGRSVGDTHRDLAVCLAWKQVWLWFSSLA
jgi:hypothetical protein